MGASAILISVVKSLQNRGMSGRAAQRYGPDIAKKWRRCGGPSCMVSEVHRRQCIGINR